MIIQKESYSESLCQEILPLAQKCWEESTQLKGNHCSYHEHRELIIEPDWSLYKRLAELDLLVIFTLRDESLLVGYVIVNIYQSPHHIKLKVANGDTIYVEPKYRGHTAALIRKLLQELEAREVTNMGWAVSKNGPVYTLLSKLGFSVDEVVMEKLITCAS